MSLSVRLRERVIGIHTKEQLNNGYKKQWRSQSHFTRYLCDRRLVHCALDHVIPEVREHGLINAVNDDLQSLNVDYKFIHSDDSNLYTQYLRVLLDNNARPELLAHVYCFYGAHLSGGGKQVAHTAASVLPPWFFVESKYFNVDGTDDKRKEMTRLIDDESVYMSVSDATACIHEVETAYRFASMLLAR
jgi:hypothetical protein